MNIDKYNAYHIGISGGKDSTAVLLWYVYESGLPLEKLHVSFCDTQNEDALTYAYIEMLSDKVFPIQTIESEGFFRLSKRKKRFPAARARFCTQFLKVIPAREHVLNLMREYGDTLIMNGVRREEGRASNTRGEAKQFEFDEGWGCDIYRPIIDWSLVDVWDIHRKYLNIDDVLSILDKESDLTPGHKTEVLERMLEHGIPRNPLYDMGANRVGCYPCIMSRKQEIRSLANYRPERIAHIAKWESEINSTFFRRTTTPKRHRSKIITTVAGEKMHVPTIQDVVQWSRTKHGGKQYEFFLPDNQISACDIGGMCE